MKKILAAIIMLFAFVTTVHADNVLVIDAQYDQVTNNVKGRLEAAGHTVTVTTNLALIPTATSTYQQVWDLRYSAVLTAGEQTTYNTYVTGGGFAFFITENPGCCQSRNNSVAALITALGGGTTTIGANSAMTNNVSSNVNTTYMTPGITVNYAAVSAIVNSKGIPLISDGNNAVSAMSWIGRAGNLGAGVTGTIVTVADTNWLDASRFSTAGTATSAQKQNVTALDDIIKGIVAGTVGGTISANGNGAAAQNGNSGTPPPPPAPTTFSIVNTTETVQTNTMTPGAFTGNGGALKVNSARTTVANPITLNDTGMTIDSNSLDGTFSGVISGTGSLTIAESGANGSVNLTAQNTLTGPTVINNGAKLINDGSIASSSGVTNNGTFNNNGQAPNVTNNGTATNNVGASAGNITNSGVFNNNGAVDSVINYATGLFLNKGTTGAVTNSGTLKTTGVVGAITNNATGYINVGGARVVVLSTGSNYGGNTVAVIQPQIEATVLAIKARMPDAKIIMVIPYANMLGTTTVPATAATAVAEKFGIPQVIFTNSADKIHPANYPGVVTQIQSLTGVPSNQWFFVGDSITVGLAGAAGVSTNTAVNGMTPKYILDNFVPLLPGGGTAVTTGNINNAGIFNLLGPATIGSVTNSGYLSVQYSGGHVTMPAFTQTAAGGIVMVGGQQLNINGAANLNGAMIVMNAPTAFGRYNLINAGSVVGTFTSLSVNEKLNAYLSYSSTNVKLFITPSVAATRQGVDAIKGNSETVNAIVSGRTTGALGNECAGENGCISLGFGNDKSGTGNLRSGSITVGKNFESAKFGVFLDRSFNNPKTGTVSYKPSNPVMGGYVGWTNNNLSATLSTATGYGHYMFNRSLVDGAEVGVGRSKVDSRAYQAKVSYNMPISDSLALTPYGGLRYTKLEVRGYTELGPVFPLSINPYKQKSIDLVAGLGVNKNLTEKFSINANVGLTRNLRTNSGSFNGQSEIGGYSSFDSQFAKGKNITFGTGAGLNYKLNQNQNVGLNVGFEQKSLINPSASSIGLTYTYGF